MPISAPPDREAEWLVGSPLGVHEYNALTAVASGAGYMAGGDNMAVFGALLMVTTVRSEPLPMIAWFALIALLGVFATIPIKRQLINQEGLGSSRGTAPAETIRSIHDAAPGGGANKARWLAGSAVFVVDRTRFRNAWHFIPGTIGLPVMLAGRALAEWMRHQLPALAGKTVGPVASGFIAGESHRGILIALLIVTGVIAK